MPTVSIDRIDLSLRGISPSTAQSALASLGPALTHALAAQPLTASATGSLRVERLDSAPLRIEVATTASALSATLARHIATTVSRQLGPARPI